MADINSVKDASGNTIEDYKRMYQEAKDANDAAGMQAANEAANAIRTSQNVAAEYANVDIANTAAKNNASNTGSVSSTGSTSGYTTLNQQYPSQGALAGDAYFNQVYNNLLNQINYGNENPAVTQGFTQDEFNALYGNVQSPTAQGYTIGQMYNIGSAGQYTYDAAEAAYAAAQGYTVQQTTYNGNPAYIITPNENTSRTQQSGTSGADESLLNSQQYAAVQYEKQQWSNYNELYQQALAEGKTALAEQYLAARDQAHTNAERIRASAWLGSYSGGADGSTYLTYGMLANPDIYNQTGASAYTGANAYADALAQQYPNLYGSASEVQAAINNLNQNSSQSSLNGSLSGGTSSGSLSGLGSGTGNTGTTTTITMPTLEIPEVPTADSISSQVTDYSDYIKEMQAALLESNLASLEAAYQKNVNAIDRAGEGVNAQYQDARNQTAGASELAARNFNELAAAHGLNTGASGQAELSRNVTLQNNLNALNMQEAQTLADLDLQRANAETDYNTAIAQANAEGKYQEAQLLYQEKIRVETAMIEAIQQEFNNAVTQYQLQYQALRDSVSDSQWQAQFDLAYEQWMQDVNIQLAQLELQKQSLAMQQQQLNAELAQMSASTSGTTGTTGTSSILSGLLSGYSSGANTTTTTSTSNKVSYNNGSLTSDQVKQLQSYYGLTADGYWGPNSQSSTGLSADQAWAQYIASNNTPDVSAADLLDSIVNQSGFASPVNTKIEQQVNSSLVDAVLTNMKNSGANMTEIRAALREAYYNGDIDQAAYEELRSKYLGNWS